MRSRRLVRRVGRDGVLSSATSFWRARDYPGSGTTIPDGHGVGDLTIVGSPSIGDAVAIAGASQYLTSTTDNNAWDPGAAVPFSVLVAYSMPAAPSGNYGVLMSKRADTTTVGYSVAIRQTQGRLWGFVQVVTESNPEINLNFADGVSRVVAFHRDAAGRQRLDASTGQSTLADPGAAANLQSGDVGTAVPLTFGRYDDGTNAATYQWYGAAVLVGRCFTMAEVTQAAKEFRL